MYRPSAEPAGRASSGAGRALLNVIRLLVEMAPEERIALIELLKALG